MISSEVQRTLVKSPPELWAEISDPESLARHLGEFGEIRITRVHPEQKIEWEGENASGTVVINPSGWGTKVKLTVTRELSPDLGESDVEPELAAEPDPARELESEPDVDAGSEPACESEHEHMAEPRPRRGFFARLFGRRRSSPHEPEDFVPDAAADAEASHVSALAVEPEPPPCDAVTSSSEPEPRAESDERADLADENEADDEARRSDIAAELAAAEEDAAEQVTTVLTGVLDRLGAAHHRPFSRS